MINIHRPQPIIMALKAVESHGREPLIQSTTASIPHTRPIPSIATAVIVVSELHFGSRSISYASLQRTTPSDPRPPRQADCQSPR